MIQTIRDAEQRINELRREVEELKKQVRFLSNQTAKNGSAASQSDEIVESIDSKLTSGGNTVLHQLYHIFQSAEFKEISAKLLEVKDLNVENNLTVGNDLTVSEDITAKNINVNEDAIINDNLQAKTFRLGIGSSGEATSTTQFHLGSDSGTQGLYLMALGPTVYILHNVSYDGAAWIAKGNKPKMVVFESTGEINWWWSDTMFGEPVVWGISFGFSQNGGITFHHATAAANTRTSMSVYSKAEVDAAINNAFTQLVNGKANHGTYPVSGGAGGSVTI